MQADDPNEALGPRIVPSKPSDQPIEDPVTFEDLVSESLQEKEEPAEPEKSAGSGDIPTILLVQAGLTVFNGVIILIYLGMWIVDLDLLASALRSGAGIALLLSIAPMALGSYIERKNRKAQTQPAGLRWAHAGVYAGAAMSSLTLIIPLIVSVRAMLGGN